MKEKKEKEKKKSKEITIWSQVEYVLSLQC